MISAEVKNFLRIVNDNCEKRDSCMGCNFRHGDCIINLSGEVNEILFPTIPIKQIDKIRNMPIEEIAKERVRYVEGEWQSDKYIGDFGSVEVGGKLLGSDYAAAEADAIRLEIEWLLSEVLP
jgi:hypothetical protein